MTLLNLEGKLFNKMDFAYSSSTLAPTFINFLIRDIKIFIWLDIDVSSFILSLNNCNFMETFAFVAFAPNSWIKCSHISLHDLVRLTWCNSEYERTCSIMDLDLASLLSHSNNYLASIGATFVPFIMPFKFLFINCICSFNLHG